MPITSQVRLEQVTGSLDLQRPTSLAKLGDMNTAAAGAFAAADVQDILKYYAQAIANIHGELDVGNQDPGSFSQDIYSDQDNTRELGLMIVAPGTSISSIPNGPGSNLTASTATLEFGGSGLAGSGFSGGETVKVEDNSGHFMLFVVTSSASAGATSIDVAFLADGSSHDTLAVADLTSFSTVTVSTKEWKTVRSPQIRSEEDMTVEAYGPDKKITLSVHQSGNEGILLQNSNTAGAITAKVGANAALTVHDDRLEASLTTDAANPTSVASLQVKGGAAVAKKIFAGDNIAIGADQKVIAIGSTANDRLIFDHKSQVDAGLPGRLHQSGSFDLLVSSDQKVKVAGSSGSTVLSGSAGVSFPADGGFGFGGSSEGGVLLCQHSDEAVDYRAILDSSGVAFGNQTSILSAFAKLDGKIAAGEPTLFKFEAPAGHTPGAVVTVSKVAGDAPSLATGLAANKLDVYVNGQLLLAGTGKDYNVTATNQITFEFNIQEDDVVIAIDRS